MSPAGTSVSAPVIYVSEMFRVEYQESSANVADGVACQTRKIRQDRPARSRWSAVGRVCEPVDGACPTEAGRDALGLRHTDVLVELPHEGNAELADLVVGLALGVEVASSLTTAHIDYYELALDLYAMGSGMTYGQSGHS
jgi:hypothetical protein